MEHNEDGYTVREPDHELQLALNGDQEALGCLLASYRPHLYRAALRVLGTPQDAEEALQDGFVQVVQHFREFEGRSRFSTWLTRIVFNAALMHLRKNRTHVVASIDQEPPGGGDAPLAAKIADSRPDPEEAYAHAERLQILERTLLELPALYRSTVLLRDFEGLSTEEAAEVLSITEGTLKSRLHRARRMIVRQGQSATASFRKFPASSRRSCVTSEDARSAANEAIRGAGQGFALSRTGRAKPPLNGRAMPRIGRSSRDGLATETSGAKGSYPEATALEPSLPLLLRRS